MNTARTTAFVAVALVLGILLIPSSGFAFTLSCAPSCQGMDLRGMNLSGADLRGVNLVNADLDSANLVGADLTDADVVEADFSGADMTGANLTRTFLYRVTLQNARLVNANLSDTHLHLIWDGADLTGADLSRAYIGMTDGTATLSRAKLYRVRAGGAQFSGYDLTLVSAREASFTNANLIGARLTGADLTSADLVEARLARANLSGVNLTSANLARADLRSADLTGANLTGANLARVNLIDADLTGANLGGARLAGAQMPDGWQPDPANPPASLPLSGSGSKVKLKVSLDSSRRKVGTGQSVRISIRVENTGLVRAVRVRACLPVPRGLLALPPTDAGQTGRTHCFSVAAIAAGDTVFRHLVVRATKCPCPWPAFQRIHKLRAYASAKGLDATRSPSIELEVFPRFEL